MTLDEAIKHAEEVAERLENSCKRDWMGEDDKSCASDHRQLAEWLKELKQLREQTRWIPIGERLPEEGQSILVTTNGWYVVAIIRTFFKDMHKDIIAWMPLPKPYTTESEDKE